MFKIKGITFSILMSLSFFSYPMNQLKRFGSKIGSSIMQHKKLAVGAAATGAVCWLLNKLYKQHQSLKPGLSSEELKQMTDLITNQGLSNIDQDQNEEDQDEKAEKDIVVSTTVPSSISSSSMSSKSLVNVPAAADISKNVKYSVRWHRYVTKLSIKDLAYFIRYNLGSENLFGKYSKKECAQIVRNILNENITFKELKEIFSSLTKHPYISEDLSKILNKFPDETVTNDLIITGLMEFPPVD